MTLFVVCCHQNKDAETLVNTMESLPPDMRKMMAVNPFLSTHIENESHHLSVVRVTAPKIFTKIEDAATFFV